MRAALWAHPKRARFEALAAVAPPAGGSAGAGAPVLAAAALGDVGLYDLATGETVGAVRVLSDATTADAASARAPPAPLQRLRPHGRTPGGGAGLTGRLRVDELCAPPPRPFGARCVLPLRGGAALLTAGSDACVRFWDLGTPGARGCYAVSASPAVEAEPIFSSCDSSGVRLLRCAPLEAHYADGSGTDGGAAAAAGHNARATHPGHRDAVLSMCAVEGSGGSALLATGARDGVVKIWC